MFKQIIFTSLFLVNTMMASAAPAPICQNTEASLIYSEKATFADRIIYKNPAIKLSETDSVLLYSDRNAGTKICRAFGHKDGIVGDAKSSEEKKMAIFQDNGSLSNIFMCTQSYGYPCSFVTLMTCYQ